MNDDVFPELRRHRVQKFARIDRLVPRLDLAALDPLFLFAAQLGEFFTQEVEVFAKLARQRCEPALMLGLRQLDEAAPLLLAILTLSLLAGLTLLALPLALLLPVLALDLLLGLALLLGLMFFSALLASTQLTTVLARLLLDLLDNRFDHRRERGLIDAVLSRRSRGG